MEPPESAVRRGRPRRLDPDAITEAVLELGVENATMRRVAQHLGVSLPGLYHHVRNQDELMKLAAQRTLAQSPPPRYLGQHWAQWLRAYATYIRTALASEPALLEKFLDGALGDASEMAYIGEALDALNAQGLEPDQAIAAWAAITALAIGSATEGHRERNHAQRGQPWLARIFAFTARRAASDYPTLRAVATSECDPFGDEAFQHRITLLLNGIGAQYRLTAEP